MSQLFFLSSNQTSIVCGVDEVGRGPLFGDVVACAVILDETRPIAGLADSKKLTAQQRQQLAGLIKQQAHAVSIARASVEEIDTLNILHATMLAMQRAVQGLSIAPDLALIDGNRCPELPCAAQAVVKGDSKHPCISAASIVAKVTRDKEMHDWHQIYPHYHLDKHKGYPTKQHLAAIAEHGICQYHRRSFRPVAEIIAGVS